MIVKAKENLKGTKDNVRTNNCTIHQLKVTSKMRVICTFVPHVPDWPVPIEREQAANFGG